MLKNKSYAIYLGDDLNPVIGMIPYQNTIVKIIRAFSRTQDTGRQTYVVEMIDESETLVMEEELLPHIPIPSWHQIEADCVWRPQGLKI